MASPSTCMASPALGEKEVYPAVWEGRGRLAVVLGLTSAYFVAEVVGGVLTNSLVLLSDAGHMLADVGALTMAFLAMTFASRPATPRKSYGYYRLEILAAFLNAVALILIDAYIFYEAYRRFIDPPEVQSAVMLMVALGGLVVNLAGARMLHGISKESLNLRGAFLHILTDALGSVGAIAAGLIMLYTEWYLADPLFSATIGLMLLPSIWRLLKDSVNVLLEGCPSEIELPRVREAVLGVRGVRDVHDLHVWVLASGMYYMTAHVTVDSLGEGQKVLTDLNKMLLTRFNIAHATIQLEEHHAGEEHEFRGAACFGS